MKLSANLEIIIATTVIFIMIMLISAYSIWPEIRQKNTFSFEEEKLNKTILKIKAGEKYIYQYTVGKQRINITYVTMQGQGCILISSMDIKIGSQTCVKSDGTDEIGSNLSLSNPAIYFFKPWMLAVKKDWSWDVKIISGLSNKTPLTVLGFRQTGEENYAGRDVFVVSTTENGKETGTIMAIDKEKRVLLKEEGENYVLELIAAPFPLGQQGE